MIVSRICSQCGHICRDLYDYGGHLITVHGWTVRAAGVALGFWDDDGRGPA